MTLRSPTQHTFLTSLVGISPSRARHVAADLALQRLQYATGRTLTESAIETEQAWVEARLGVAGRRLSAGIVSGLRVGVADQAAEAGRFTLSSGRAIAPGGQDISVLKPSAFLLDDLGELMTTGFGDGAPRGLLALVLRPVVVEVERLPQDASRTYAFEDPCPPDATSAPYLDFVLQDAALVGWVALDPALAGADAARAPNIAAEALRRLEEADANALPWAEAGVPVALMSVADDGQIEWAHRAAVARRGGMLPAAGRALGDRIRQARLEGLVEETGLATRAAGWDGTNGAGFLRHLPPAGILPRKCWAQPGFFPAGWGVAQAPIPQSQLDAALEAAARLAPYDLDAVGDRVKFLVPVPDALYAPDLLEPATLPDFEVVRVPLRQRIGDTLALRNAYRTQARAVQGVIDLAAVSDFTEAEEDPIPGEDSFPAAQPDPDSYDDEAIGGLKAIFAALDPILFTNMQLSILNPARLEAPLEATGPYGVTPFVNAMRALIDTANDTVDFSFNRVQAEIYRLRQIMLDNEEATKLATFPALAGLAKGQNAHALSEGLKANFLSFKADNEPRDGGGGFDGSGIIGAGGAIGGGGISASIAPTMRAPRSDILSGGSAPLKLDPSKLSRGNALRATSAVSELKASTMISSFGGNAASLNFGAIITDTRVAFTGMNATLVKDLVDNTRAELVDDAVLSSTAAKRIGILAAAPLPGDIRDIRSVTIADRLKASASVGAKASAIRIKADVLRQLQAMGISLEGLSAPLTSARDRVLLPSAEIDRVIGETLSANEQRQFEAQIGSMRSKLQDTGAESWEVMALPPAILSGGQGTASLTPMSRLGNALLRERAPFTLNILPALVLTKQLDPDPNPRGDDNDLDDESAFLASAVATLEGAIAYLRAVEGRILAISGAVETVAARLPGLFKVQGSWESALALVDQDLDEARHDLRVAISLIDEETARLAELAAHRQRVLEAVKFVAYTRPRALKAHRAGDTLGLMLPGAIEDPLPATLRRDVDLPGDLEAMVGALREMPLGWFASNPELAAKFVSPAYMTHLFGGVKTRAVAAQTRFQPQPLALQGRANPAMMQVQRISNAYRSLTLKLFDARAHLDLSLVAQESWTERRRRALALLSLNDLIEGGKQPAVAKLAATEIEQIERVIHALWQMARQVPPPIRLLWAQELSAYDTVTNLAGLSRLPGWPHVDFALRKKMERLNGWLFSRMEKGVGEAHALMTDLVRVAILLAAHAPVADIIAARIEEEQSAAPGVAVDIVIHRGAPKIGMNVAFLDANQVQARGVVRDLYGSRARVEIMHTAAALVTITPAQKVTMFAAASLSLTSR